ncbi:hypothetical protein JCM8202_004382 [Rhodotorula sphaerocarpa]
MPRPRLATFVPARLLAASPFAGAAPVRRFHARPLRAPASLAPARLHGQSPASSSQRQCTIRSLSTARPAQASYRRFGDPPRPLSRRQPEERQDLNAKDVFSVLDILRKQQQAGGGGRQSGRGGLPSIFDSASSRYRHDPRQGFSWHNFKAYIRSPFFIILVSGGGAYYVVHLERVPETGRWRFMDVTPSMEVEMGEQAFQETVGEYGRKILPDYHPQARFVQGVVKRIIKANGLEGKAPSGWKTYVVKEDGTKNAFVLPNGTIFVFTGILPVAADADGLACVLGHEIAHQVARHSAERMSGVKVFYGLALLLASFGIDMGLSQVLLQFVYSLPNSRKNETEADLIGLRLANQACFDPRAAEGLWQRMSATEETPGVDMSFLSTHPSSKNRTVQVREWAEEVIRDRPTECGPLRQQVQPFQQVSRARW